MVLFSGYKTRSIRSDTLRRLLMAERKHTITSINDIKPGMLVYAAPGNLIVQEVLTTQTLNSQRRDKHPLVVLSVNTDAQEITVTYVASFAKAGALKDVDIAVSAKKLLLPVAPATKEFDLEVIDWEKHWDENRVGCWVSIRSKKKMAGEEVRGQRFYEMA